MPNKIANRVKMTVSGTPGTGTITLGSAVAGFQSFAGAGVSNADTVPYIIEDGAAWEIGVGTYTSSGTTMSRSVTASSNSGNAINATSAAIVMISPLAADLQAGTAANNLVALDGSAKLPAVDGSALTNLNAGAATSGTLAVARGGTGLTSLTAGYIPYGNGTGAFSSSAGLFYNGNFGLGVTPSAWSGLVASQVGNGSLSSGTSGNNALIASNAYFTGSVWRYITNGNATYYTQFNGTHGWVTAASGTAGNTISFTQAMTLDASGRLGIGTSSPATTLEVSGVGRVSGLADPLFAVNATGTQNNAIQWLRSGTVHAAIFVTNAGAVNFRTVLAQPIALETNGTSRFTVDGSGNVRVVGGVFNIFSSDTTVYDTNAGGDVSGVWKLQASGNNSAKFIAGSNSATLSYCGFAGNNAASKSIISAAIVSNLSVTTAGSEEGYLAFHTKPSGNSAYNSERARITSTGLFGVGTTNPSELIEANVNSAAFCVLKATNTAGSGKFGVRDTGDAYIEAPSGKSISFWNTARAVTIDSSGNLLVGTANSPTSGTRSLTVANGTAPTASPADTITIYSTDLSAGNTMLSLYTEGTPVNSNTTAAATHRIAIRVNGTVYYLLANTAA
jgi:hypothetical protein